MEWLEENKLPIGKVIARFVDFLNDYFFWFFDGLTQGLTFLIEGTANLLLAVHPIALIAAIAAVAFYVHRAWKLTALIIPSLLLIINQGYWEGTMFTLSLVIWATIVCMAFGVPIGIAAAHRPRLWLVLRPILDMMQTLPTFVYLIPALILFGLGMAPGLIATVIFAIAAPVRMTYLGISSVPKPLVEAAESFGANKRQLLWKVEVPHALPTMMAGFTQCIMLSLSMVVIAAMVGAPGLGIPVLRAINTVNTAKGFEAGLAIVIVAILLDRICKKPGGSSEGR